MALRLTDTERANIRAALLAMGPERRARLEGQCFNHRRRGDFNYTNTAGYCAVGLMLDETEGVYMRISRELRDITAQQYAGLHFLIRANDAGQLRTKAAVAELLALAE